MSVAQVKKRFAEMEAHLCRDKESLRRLKLLKDDVNVLRTSLAAAQESEERAEREKTVSREKADRLEIERDELKKEIERLNQKNASLECEKAVAERHLESLMNKERVPFATGDLVNDLAPERIHRWAIKTLKEQRGTLVKPRRCPQRYPFGFAIEDVLNGFDEYGFAALGRTIFLQLLLRSSVSIFWNYEDDNFDHKKLMTALWGQKGMDKAKMVMLKLFLHQYDTRSDDDALDDLLSGRSRMPEYSDDEPGSSVDSIFGARS